MFLKLLHNNEAHILHTNQSIDLKTLLSFIQNKFKKLPQKYTLIYKYGNNQCLCVNDEEDMKVFMKMNVDKAKLEIVEVGDGDGEIFNRFFGRERQCQKDDCQPEIIDDDDLIKKNLNLEPCQDQKQKILRNNQQQNQPDQTPINIQNLSTNKPNISQPQKPITTRQPDQSSSLSNPNLNLNPNQVIHTGVSCDECQMKPIIGIRYKCTTCNNFDLCEKCQKKSNHSHVFAKVKKNIDIILKMDSVIVQNGQNPENIILNQYVEDKLKWGFFQRLSGSGRSVADSYFLADSIVKNQFLKNVLLGSVLSRN